MVKVKKDKTDKVSAEDTDEVKPGEEKAEASPDEGRPFLKTESSFSSDAPGKTPPVVPASSEPTEPPFLKTDSEFTPAPSEGISEPPEKDDEAGPRAEESSSSLPADATRQALQAGEVARRDFESTEPDQEETEAVDEPDEEETEAPEPLKSGSVFNKKNALIALLVVAGLGVTGGGIFIYKKAISSSPVEEAAQAGSSFFKTEELDQASSEANSVVLSPAPTSAPASELSRKDLKVQILNGSGVVGAAGEAKEFLEGLGYEGMEVGNADNYDYEKTEVSLKESKKDYLDLITKDLSEKYTLSSDAKTLDAASDFDLAVTLGKE